MIEFDDQFEVPAAPDDVMARFMDVERVAECVPGVSLRGRDAEGNHLGTMTVAFGPKRIKFEGKLRCDFDAAQRTGLLTGGGMAAGRGAAVKVRTQFAVIPAPDATPSEPRSLVTISSRADLQGVLASFAATGGAVLARQVMQEFAAALTAQLSPAAAAAPGEAAAATAQPAPKPQALSAGSLIWRTFTAWLRSWFPRSASAGKGRAP
jgi:carbon monoxide dehydrogenase subunit G